MPAINISRRLILPGLGVVVFLFAYLAQNVWQIFHIDDITRAIRSLDQAGVVPGMAVLGFVEATDRAVFLCSRHRRRDRAAARDAARLGAGLAAGGGADGGTLLGYGASLVLGRVLQQRLPSLVGEAYFRKVQSLDRALRSAGLRGRRVPSQPAGDRLCDPRIFPGRSGSGATLSWPVWRNWSGGASMRPPPTSSRARTSYRAAISSSMSPRLFSVWFLYELFSRQPQNVP